MSNEAAETPNIKIPAPAAYWAPAAVKKVTAQADKPPAPMPSIIV